MAQSKADTAAPKPVGQSVSAERRKARLRRHARLRKKISGTPERPRLVVHRSSRHIHVQLVNDLTGTTVAAASSIEADVRGVEGDKKAHSVRVELYLLWRFWHGDVPPPAVLRQMRRECRRLVAGVEGLAPSIPGLMLWFERRACL